MSPIRQALVLLIVGIVTAIVVAPVLYPSLLDAIWHRTNNSTARTYTLDQRLDEIGPAATKRLQIRFSEAGVAYPPRDVRIVAFKAEKRLELYARDGEGGWKLVKAFPVLAASGVAGPKLREGDSQVPEGIYRVSYLNPNSRYRVSLRLDYPNAEDVKRAAKDKRSNLGGDIMIHGGAASIGCLAMGDPVAEELFVLAATVGIDKVTVIVAPTDIRGKTPAVPAGAPAWTADLYRDIGKALAELPTVAGGQG